jgi:hypothetical protein
MREWLYASNLVNPYFSNVCWIASKSIIISFNSSIHSPTLPLQLVGINVILDMESMVGQITSPCISMALQDLYQKHTNYTTTILPTFVIPNKTTFKLLLQP